VGVLSLMGTDKNLTGHTCGLRAGTTATYVEKNRYIPKQHSRSSVLVGKPEGSRPLEDLSADGRIILKWKLISFEGVNWIYLAQERDKWQALVNGFTNLRFHKTRLSSCLAEELTASQEKLCSM